MEHNRRKHDNMTDHDLIIAHSVKIDTLCKLIKTNTKQLDAFSDKLDKRCVHIHDGIADTHKEIFAKIDKKTDGTTFRLVVGIIVVAMLSLAGMVGNDIMAHRTVTQVQHKINDTRGDLL